MSMQEAALYGDLVLYLRQQMAERLVAAKAVDSLEAAQEQLDVLIRDWFFNPQTALHGSAPKDIIWREQLNLGNPVSPEVAQQLIDDDCPICQGLLAESEAAEAERAEHQGHHHVNWQWHYDPETALIDLYDPEGSTARWEQERLLVQPQLDSEAVSPDTPTYEPPAIEDLEVSPDEFLDQVNWRSQQDERLAEMAQGLIDRLDFPYRYDMFGPKYRRLELLEGMALLNGLEEQGVDLDEFVAHLEAWPYENVALDWVADPERHLYFTTRAMETRLDPADKSELIRFRQHRDFLFILCQLIPFNARLWLQGWLEGMALGALELDEEDEAWDGELGELGEDGDGSALF